VSSCELSTRPSSATNLGLGRTLLVQNLAAQVFLATRDLNAGSLVCMARRRPDDRRGCLKRLAFQGAVHCCKPFPPCQLEHRAAPPPLVRSTPIPRQTSRSPYIGVDVGGTFTDFSVSLPGRKAEILHKAPSTPGEPDRAIIEGLKQILARGDIEAAGIIHLAHGTTVGTNALIQRRVGKVAMVTTVGFRDLLEIGRQTRPKVYDIHLDNPKPLVPRELRFEVPERMRAGGTVHVTLDERAFASIATRLAGLDVDCVAVCFLHAHAFPATGRAPPRCCARRSAARSP